eukprot:GHUV01047837.1.p1 GENE.GHUV01047837.1~~GHUV01047837.1.p1  ORF type:complete len:133 (-),score=20.90 GHUV01047837.1:228-626(-)
MMPAGAQCPSASKHASSLAQCWSRSLWLTGHLAVIVQKQLGMLDYCHTLQLFFVKCLCMSLLGLWSVRKSVLAPALLRDHDLEGMSDGFDKPTAYGLIDGFDDPSMGWARWVGCKLQAHSTVCALDPKPVSS